MSNDVIANGSLSEDLKGNIREDDFRFVESPVPTPDQGQVLVRWLSFDPTQSGWMRRGTYIPMIPLGDVMRAASVGQVIQSRHPGYKPGEPSERRRRRSREWKPAQLGPRRGFLAKRIIRLPMLA